MRRESANEVRLRKFYGKRKNISFAAHTRSQYHLLDEQKLMSIGVPHNTAKQYAKAGIPFELAKTYWLSGVRADIAIAFELRKRRKETQT